MPTPAASTGGPGSAIASGSSFPAARSNVPAAVADPSVSPRPPAYWNTFRAARSTAHRSSPPPASRLMPDGAASCGSRPHCPASIPPESYTKTRAVASSVTQNVRPSVAKSLGAAFAGSRAKVFAAAAEPDRKFAPRAYRRITRAARSTSHRSFPATATPSGSAASVAVHAPSLVPSAAYTVTCRVVRSTTQSVSPAGSLAAPAGVAPAPRANDPAPRPRSPSPYRWVAATRPSGTKNRVGADAAAAVGRMTESTVTAEPVEPLLFRSRRTSVAAVPTGTPDRSRVTVLPDSVAAGPVTAGAPALSFRNASRPVTNGAASGLPAESSRATSKASGTADAGPAANAGGSNVTDSWAGFAGTTNDRDRLTTSEFPSSRTAFPPAAVAVPRPEPLPPPSLTDQPVRSGKLNVVPGGGGGGTVGGVVGRDVGGTPGTTATPAMTAWYARLPPFAPSSKANRFRGPTAKWSISSGFAAGNEKYTAGDPPAAKSSPVPPATR